MAGGSGYPACMAMLAPNRYACHRFPPEIISPAVWLYFRFPLSFRMVEEMLAAGGIPSATRPSVEVSNQLSRRYSHQGARMTDRQLREGARCILGGDPKGDASVPPPTASIQCLNWPFLNIRITSKPLIVA